MIENVLFARQPIFDSKMNTVAYELLYRDNKGIGPDEENFDSSAATTDVLLSTYCNVLENGHLRLLPAYVNFEAQWLNQETLPDVPEGTLVLEVQKNFAQQSDVFVRLGELYDSGYNIALDNFDEDESLETAIDYANIVKVDIRKFIGDSLSEHVENLKQHNVTLLAQKIESYDEFERCKDLGFEMFQGYFFARPQLVKGRKLEQNDLAILELLGALSNDDSSFEDLEAIIQKDPELTLGILRIVNSSRFRRVRSISRVSEAVAMIGLQELKKWALLISMQKSSEKPGELLSLILQKAKMCELAAPLYNNIDRSSAFMVGVLSGVEALLDLPLQVILTQLPIDVDLKHALTGVKNSLGGMLKDVDNYIQGDWDTLNSNQCQQLNICYDQALTWTQEIQLQLHH